MYHIYTCLSFCSQWGAGGGFPACITDHMTRGGSSSGGGGCMHPGAIGRTPQALWNMANKRVVRILLECILVIDVVIITLVIKSNELTIFRGKPE